MIKTFRYSKKVYFKIIGITFLLYFTGSIVYNFFPNVIIAILSLIVTFLYFGIMIRKYRKNPIMLDTEKRKVYINTKIYNEKYDEYDIFEVKSITSSKLETKCGKVYNFHTKIEKIDDLINLLQGDGNER